MIYQKHSNMVSRRIMDEVILVPISRNAADMQNIYSLNSTGARVWDLLDGKNSAEQILQTLVEEHEVDAQTVRSDFDSLMADLREIGAVEEIQT
ncbi:MAG: PqqD family protein [Deltaproteobacteria bacterium]|nr:PqqD family protein [Deltaproteobacteria bacterium]